MTEPTTSILSEAILPLSPQVGHDGTEGGTAKSSSWLRRSRATRLLEQVIASGAMSVEALAAALVTTPEALQEYRAGRARMPLDRQLCLAVFVLEHLSELSRVAHGLRGQVEAEMSFIEQRTATHKIAPVARWR